MRHVVVDGESEEVEEPERKRREGAICVRGRMQVAEKRQKERVLKRGLREAKSPFDDDILLKSSSSKSSDVDVDVREEGWSARSRRRGTTATQ